MGRIQPVIKRCFLTDGFNRYNFLTVVFAPFTTGFLLSLLIIGLCLMNADYIYFIFTDAVK